MSTLYQRHLLDLAKEALGAFPVLVIQGARQVGKSTFAGLLVEGRRALVATLDDEQSLAAAQADPRAFVERVPDGILIIDEVQRAPELILPIKAAVDRDRRPGRFVLTGSSDLLRLERTPDSLAGRAMTIDLQGLSQGEISGRRDDFVARLASSSVAAFTTDQRREDYASMLAIGGYPEIHRLGERMRRSWLDSYLARIVQRDARDITRLTQPQRLESVLRLLAANQAGELVKARLADKAEIPAASITTYLDVLLTLFLSWHLPPWTPNLAKREIGRSKVVISDSALAMRLGRLTAAQVGALTGADQLGPLLEGFVASELRKQSGWSEEEYQLFHYRDRDGLEVDVVIECADGSIYGLEVKAAKTFKDQHFSGLRGLANRAGDRFRGGFVLNTSEEGFQYSKRLWGLPIAALWEL